MVQYNEDEIQSKFGNNYDHPKPTPSDGLEDSQNGHPRRHISKWFLLKNTKKACLSEKVRHPLPDSCNFSNDYKLHGLLIPTKENTSYKPIEVKISEPKIWVLNRSHISRGLWIESRKAWYQLKDADTSTPTLMVKVSSSKRTPCLFPSQEKVHTKLRANFALVSNIVDVFSEVHNEKEFFHISKYAKCTPLELHTQSKNPNSQLNGMSDNETNREPFDYQLLQKSAAFCRQHLLDFHVQLNEECTFIKGLDNLIKSAVMKDEDHEYYIRTAEEAERRSGRTAWGDKLTETDTKLNSSDLDEEGPSNKSSYPKKRRFQFIDEDSSDDDLPFGKSLRSQEDPQNSSKKQKSHQKSPKINAVSNIISEILGYENDINILVAPTGMPSKENISKAKVALAQYLTPTSTENSEEDYVSYSIDDENMKDIMEQVIFNTNVPSLEFLLLLVESVRTGGKKMMKGIFKKNKSKGIVGGEIIFKKWLCCALNTIQERYDSTEEYKGQSVEILLVVSIMNLICDFHVIKDAKQLAILKSKFSIDWSEIVEKTLTFSSAYELDDIIQSCNKAKIHLEKMMAGTNDEKKKKATPPPKELEENIVDLTEKIETAPVVIDVDSEKSEKDRLRKARMAQMLNAAKCRAGTADREISRNMNHSKYNSKSTFSSQQENLSNSGKYQHNQRDSWNRDTSDKGISDSRSMNDSGWNKRNKPNDHSSDWGESSFKGSGSSGWGAKATKDPSSGDWNAKSSQKLNSNNREKNIPESTEQSSREAKSTQNSGWNRWNAKPAQSSGGWGSTTTSGWTQSTQSSNIPESSKTSTTDTGGVSEVSFEGNSQNKFSNTGNPNDNEPAVDKLSQSGEGRSFSSSDHLRNKDQSYQHGNEQYRDDPKDRHVNQTVSSSSRGEKSDRSTNDEQKYQHGRFTSFRGDERDRDRNKHHGDRDVQRSSLNKNNDGKGNYGSNGHSFDQNNNFEPKERTAHEQTKRSPFVSTDISSNREKGPQSSTSEDGEIEENQSISAKKPGAFESNEPWKSHSWNDEEKSNRYNSTKWASNSSRNATDSQNSSRDKPQNMYSSQNPSRPIPNTSVIPPMGRGRGRGRGRGLTLPAWMTKNSGDSLGQTTSQTGPNRAEGNDEESKSDNFKTSNHGETVDREPHRPSAPADNRFQNNSRDNVSSFNRPSYDFPDSRRRYGQESDSSMGNKGRGRGGRRGTGRDTNRGRGPEGPDNSWKHSNSSDSGNIAARGRGRGRGRDQTLPAWMTQKR